jgi:hypothetical protein
MQEVSLQLMELKDAGTCQTGTSPAHETTSDQGMQHWNVYRWIQSQTTALCFQHDLLTLSN